MARTGLRDGPARTVAGWLEAIAGAVLLASLDYVLALIRAAQHGPSL